MAEPVVVPIPSAPEQPARKPRRRHLVLDISIIAGVVIVYILSLLGYHLLATAPGPLPEPVLNTDDGTVVWCASSSCTPWRIASM